MGVASHAPNRCALGHRQDLGSHASCLHGVTIVPDAAGCWRGKLLLLLSPRTLPAPVRSPRQEELQHEVAGRRCIPSAVSPATCGRFRNRQDAPLTSSPEPTFPLSSVCLEVSPTHHLLRRSCSDLCSPSLWWVVCSAWSRGERVRGMCEGASSGHPSGRGDAWRRVPRVRKW